MLLCFEMFLGGGGDTFSFKIYGTRISFRMLLFGISFLQIIMTGRIKIYNIKFSIVLILLFFYCSLSLIVGLIRNDVSAAIKNFLTVTYMLIYFPMMGFCDNKTLSFKGIDLYLQISAVIMSVFSLAVYSILLLGIMDYQTMLDFVQQFGVDFRIRPTGAFVYAGHVFVAIAGLSIFSKLLFKKNISVVQIILFIAYTVTIFISLTRGLIIAYSLCLSAMYVYKLFRNTSGSYPFVLIILPIALGIIVYFLSSVDLSRIYNFDDYSVSYRLAVLRDGFDLMGNRIGLGTGYGITYTTGAANYNFEISLFDIFVKQGLVGLILWIIYIILAVSIVVRTYRLGYSDISAYQFGLQSILFIVLLSFTNPYLANSIGFFVFFIVIAMNNNSYYFNRKL